MSNEASTICVVIHIPDSFSCFENSFMFLSFSLLSSCSNLECNKFTFSTPSFFNALYNSIALFIVFTIINTFLFFAFSSISSISSLIDLSINSNLCLLVFFINSLYSNFIPISCSFSLYILGSVAVITINFPSKLFII